MYGVSGVWCAWVCGVYGVYECEWSVYGCGVRVVFVWSMRYVWCVCMCVWCMGVHGCIWSVVM